MESLFYVGQQVVAIVDHPQKRYIRGQEFIVLKIVETRCKCKSVCIQIFPKDGHIYVGTCTICNGNLGEDDFMFFNQEEFAPIQEIGDMTFEEALNLDKKNALELITSIPV